MLRQGDVLLVPIGTSFLDDSTAPEIPPDATPVVPAILAYGDFSGHCHLVQGNAQVVAHEGRMWVDVAGPARLLHVQRHAIDEVNPPTAEHAPIDLPEGRYFVVIEAEYTPEGARQVAD